jgi:RNA polymerase sigma-70 factor, ECF subfamily
VITQNDPLKSLMLAGLDGDAAAHRAVLAALSVRLRAYFSRRMGTGAADVEDIVQDALIAIHTRRSTYDRTQPFAPWVFAIARYKMIDHFRKNRIGRASVPIDDVDDLFTDDESDAATAPADLARLLATLPEKQRDVIRATRIDGLSVAEVAAKTGLSESDIKVSVHRGLKTLMAKFGGGNPHAD